MARAVDSKHRLLGFESQLWEFSSAGPGTAGRQASLDLFVPQSLGLSTGDDSSVSPRRCCEC